MIVSDRKLKIYTRILLKTILVVLYITNGAHNLMITKWSILPNLAKLKFHYINVVSMIYDFNMQELWVELSVGDFF